MNRRKKVAAELYEVREQLLMDADESTLDTLIEDEGISPDDVLTSMHSLISSHVQHYHDRHDKPAETTPSKLPANNIVALSKLVSMLRRENKYSREALAKRSGLSLCDIEAVETALPTSVTPRIVFTIERFFKLPERSLAEVAGLIRVEDRGFDDRITAFAAHSPGFDELSSEQRRVLHEFVSFLAERTD